MFLFSWQHPDPDSAAFEESYNGAALDNVAMFPDDSLLEGATDDGSMAGPAYLAWLRSGLPPTANIESISGGSSGSSGGTNSNPVCAIRPWASGPYFKPNALRYLDSVPFTHRAPRRWGWKNPKVIYHLEVLFAAYPDAAFVHVVRNPLDLAAAQWEHLQNRALEFATLQGGYEAASEVANERCTIASATAAALAQAKRKIPPPTGAATSTSTAAARQLLPLSKVSSSTACALSKSALHKMGTCKGTGGGRGKAAIAACASDKPPSSGSGPATNARTAPAKQQQQQQQLLLQQCVSRSLRRGSASRLNCGRTLMRLPEATVCGASEEKRSRNTTRVRAARATVVAVGAARLSEVGVAAVAPALLLCRLPL